MPRAVLYHSAALALLWLCGPAQAGCSCRCQDGMMAPSCSDQFDIPPICRQVPCPYRPVLPNYRVTPPGPVRAGKPSCPEVKRCDDVGNCVWDRQC